MAQRIVNVKHTNTRFDVDYRVVVAGLLGKRGRGKSIWGGLQGFHGKRQRVKVILVSGSHFSYLTDFKRTNTISIGAVFKILQFTGRGVQNTLQEYISFLMSNKL